MQCSKLGFHGVYHNFKISLHLRDSLLPFLSFGAFCSASDFSTEEVVLSDHGAFPMSVKHLLWLQVLLKFCISQFRKYC